MKTIVLCLILAMGSLSWAADPECTQEPREKWIKSEEMKKMAQEMGYKIKKFMTMEKCYYIKGEKDGNKVEAYFNPVDGSLVPVKK